MWALGALTIEVRQRRREGRARRTWGFGFSAFVPCSSVFASEVSCSSVSFCTRGAYTQVRSRVWAAQQLGKQKASHVLHEHEPCTLQGAHRVCALC